MLSLCMIVKNEENNLQECLDRVKAYVDEMIIVDTGSSDRTKSIARSFTDKVFDFKWCDDFSAARNFSIEQASNDWVLILDGDEFITEFSVEAIKEFTQKEENAGRVGRIIRINRLETEFGEQKHSERINRIFNKNYFCYSGIIHEQVQARDKREYETVLLPIAAEHIGYTKEVVNRTNKIQRNIDLLKVDLDNHPNDPYMLFQLGKSYYMLQDYRTAADYFKKALVYPLNYKLEYVGDMIETLGYALINAGSYEDALKILKYADYYVNIPDFHFLLGLVYMNNGMFPQAIDEFLRCTSFSGGKAEGVTTYLPLYNIGVIHDVLGHRNESMQYYRKCGDYLPAVRRLKEQLN